MVFFNSNGNRFRFKSGFNCLNYVSINIISRTKMKRCVHWKCFYKFKNFHTPQTIHFYILQPLSSNIHITSILQPANRLP